LRVSDSRGLIDKDKLAARRIRARLSQAALARVTGIQQSHISRLERGVSDTTPKTLGQLADVLGCDITELMPDEHTVQGTIRPGATCADCDGPWSAGHVCRKRRRQPDPAPGEPARVA
jgi:DNA-binding XRE family transcriptional regulator